uniref:Biogenesis of lysosome-related organelles complex 1 subunit 7 n=1 Tax=Leersia perrieri TaxID=77586 RepID=A0A0D9X428_9ORYZ
MASSPLQMDGSDPPAASPSTAAAGDDERAAAPAPAAQPEWCEALAGAIAGVLGGALEEHEARFVATARSQDELAAAVERLNGELDKLLENAPSPVIMQQAARISSIRKRVLALNMLLRSIQRRIDNIDRIVSTGVTSDHSSHVQLHSQS